jgi:AraC family transcriptional regulator
VSSYEEIPDGMQAFDLPGGLYALFLYKGLPKDFGPMANYIFKEWIPSSIYMPDRRPHFQLMDESYRANDPEAEEEVWVPIVERK